MLHFSCSICLSMKIANFLEFKGTFVANSGSHATTNGQSIIGIFAGLRGNVDSFCIAEDFFDLLGGIGKFSLKSKRI